MSPIPPEALALIMDKLHARADRLIIQIESEAPVRLVIDEIRLLRQVALLLDYGYTKAREVDQTYTEVKGGFGFCTTVDCWQPEEANTGQCIAHHYADSAKLGDDGK